MKSFRLMLQRWYRSSRGRLASAGLAATCAMALYACGGSDDAPAQPTAGTGTADCPEIFASGFRNPWRWSFDRQGGELWVGDVGQGAREEIDRVVRGGNYGWRCFEGTLSTNRECGTEPNLLPPVAEYDRSAGSSVTGGYVYRGSAVTNLPGRYVFGDFTTGRIWHIDANAQPTATVTAPGDLDTSFSISSFGEGNDGELYVVHYGGELHGLTGTAASLSTTRVFPNLTFSQPVALLQEPAPGTRWFVVEQAGRVRVFANNQAAMPMDVGTFVDISGRVTSGGEMGLLGMAFHPDFATTTKKVYLSYTNVTAGARVSRISEFTSADGGLTLDPNSERILMVVGQPEANHNGGQVAFGPDGYLYIGLGDGGGSFDPHGTIGNGQRMTTLLGKMLRIDVNTGSPYGIPANNPFAGNALCGAPS